jgi:digeranylgeranylglycerophospholipid reductase
VFLTPELARGYIGWAVPGLGVTQVGIAARRPAVPQLGRFVRRLSEIFDWSEAHPVAYRAGLIPCGGKVRPWSRPGALLLGDAAGTVSPLTGGGIHPAMGSGRAAGIAVAGYLQDGGPDPAGAVRAAVPALPFRQLLRVIYDVMPFPERAVDVLFAVPVFRHLAQTVFFHHRGLLAWDTWHELLGLDH